MDKVAHTQPGCNSPDSLSRERRPDKGDAGARAKGIIETAAKAAAMPRPRRPFPFRSLRQLQEAGLLGAVVGGCR